MLNKTDFRILEFCSLKYRHVSSIEIAKGIKLHNTTVSDRLENLYKMNYLIRKSSGRGFIYRFNFNSEPARRFRLFIDMDFVNSLNIENINRFIENYRVDRNILCCIFYGSATETKKFNDIDLLIVYQEKPLSIRDAVFDLFQMDVKNFRNLYAIGEPRLQAALTTGRILIDMNFIFNYFENDLPIKTSEDIIKQMHEKYNVLIQSIEASKQQKDLKRKILETLELKAAIIFTSKNIPIPSRTELLNKLLYIDPQLKRLIEKTASSKTQKQLWDLFYSEIL